MSTLFHASALPDHQLALALPLVQVTWPETDLTSWLTFARSIREEGGGLLVLREVDDYICGVLAYRRQTSLSGAVLSVPLFTVADLTDRPRLAQTLIDAVETLGKKLGCQAVHLEFHLRQARLVDRLRRLGSPAELFLLQRRWE
jgi:hypothetical protein